MAKRQYRIQKPRRDWDDDDDEPRGRSGGVITSGHVWAFIVIGFILVAMVMAEMGPTSAGNGGGQYRIEGVHKGAVQLTDVQTGEFRQVRDVSLVKRCLSGSLKRGDVISLD